MTNPEELKQSQTKWDGTIRILMNCFAAFCGMLFLLFVLFFAFGGDPGGSYIDTPQRTEHGIAVSLFNQSRSGMARFEFLLLAVDSTELDSVDWDNLNYLMAEQIVDSLEHAGIAIVARRELSSNFSGVIEFEGLEADRAYVLLAPRMQDGHMTKMEMFKVERYKTD